MQSRKSFFNGAVYGSCLKRFWPVWASALLIWCVILPVSTLSLGGSARTAERAVEITRELGFDAGIFLNGVYGVIAAMAVFSFLYQQKSTGFAASLPLRRENLFLSCWLGGFSMLAGVGLVTAALTLLAQLSVGVFLPAAVLRWLAGYLLQALCFYGLAGLCAVLTGALWVLPALYLTLNFLAVGVWALVSDVLMKLVYGYTETGEALAMTLTPMAAMISWSWGVAGVDWWRMGCYALAGLAFSALALGIFRRRAMESATDVVAVPVLKPVFRWCAAFCGALCLGLLLYALTERDHYQTWWLLLFMLLGGLVGWLAAEMLIRKSYRVVKSLRGFAVFAVLLGVLTLLCGGGCFGFEGYVPDAASVASAQFLYDCYGGQVTDAADIALVREVHETLLGQKGQNDRYSLFQLTYTLTDGRTIKRTYRLRPISDGLMLRLEKLADRCQREAHLQLGVTKVLDGSAVWYDGFDWKELTLEPWDAEALYMDCIQPDIRDGGIALVTGSVAADTGEPAAAYRVYLEFALEREEGPWEYRRSDFCITPDAIRTWPALEALFQK